jgi:hypothetical protein
MDKTLLALGTFACHSLPEQHGTQTLLNTLQDVFVQGVFLRVLDTLLRTNDQQQFDYIAQPLASHLAHLLQSHTQLPMESMEIHTITTLLQLKAFVRSLQQWYQEEFDKVITVFDAYPGQWVIIKGMAHASHYPHPEGRDRWDIDVYIPDFSTAMQMASDLLAIGSTFDDLSVKQIGRQTYGWKMHLFSPQGVPLEFHIGPFQAYADGIIETPVLENSSQITYADITFAVPDILTQFLYIAAHSYRNGFITLKDINDAYMMLHTQHINLDRLRSHANASFLTPVLSELCAKVYHVYQSQEAVQAMIALHPTRREKVVGRLFGKQEKKSSRAFQWSSLPAHLLYLLAHVKKHGWRQMLSALGGRIWFGVEHHFFPERDARRESIPHFVSRCHAWLFHTSPLAISPFHTGYFSLLYRIDVNATGQSWDALFTHLTTRGQLPPWTCTPFAERLILFMHQNGLKLLLGPLGFFMPLTYYKEPVSRTEEATMLAEQVWCEIQAQINQTKYTR